MSDEEVAKLARCNGSTPAFAIPPTWVPESGAYCQEGGAPGMALREWLAGLCLQGLLAGGREIVEHLARRLEKPSATVFASLAVEYADALLVELAKKPSSGA